jgi:IS5 family transposase
VTEAGGMPLHATQTPANGDERKQVEPLLDGIKVRTGKPGRPKKRLKKIGFDKGYDDRNLRVRIRKRGIKPEIPKRVWKTKKPRGRPLKKTVPRYKAERAFSWFQRKFRRLVVRWERLPQVFSGFLQLAIVFMWIQKLI